MAKSKNHTNHNQSKFPAENRTRTAALAGLGSNFN